MKIKRQPPIQNRRWHSTGLPPELSKWVKQQSRMDGVHWSFTIANCVSHASGIPIEDIREPRKAKILKLRRII